MGIPKMNNKAKEESFATLRGKKFANDSLTIIYFVVFAIHKKNARTILVNRIDPEKPLHRFTKKYNKKFPKNKR
jgi:hypothetical protein